MQESRSKLQHYLRLSVAPHRAKHAGQGAVVAGGGHREQCVGWSTTWAVFGCVAWLQIEPNSPVVKVGARVRLNYVTSESRRVGLDERDSHLSAVGAPASSAQVRGVAGIGRSCSLTRSLDVDVIDAAVDHIEEVAAIGVFMQLVRAIPPGGGCCLDQ